MNILKYICLPGLLVSGDIQTVSAVESKTDKNPNILVILIDDAGYNDFGFMGSKEMQTPNIDALTSEGVVFTDAHVAATVSSPSRACLITGRYGHRFGYECNLSDRTNGLPLEEETIAEVFKTNGYRTAAIGKWHLGSRDEHNAVHTPMQATDEDMAKFEGHPRQKLAAMTYALDRGVGTVIRGLKDSGKFDNTLIFFLSDNGGATTNQSSNYPLKGFKGNKFEGGHRVPYFVVWKNGIPAGKPYDGLVSSLDIFATAIDAASISKTRNRLDGVSLLPYLKGKKGEPHKVLYWRKMDTRAIRSGDYKLIITHGVDSVLYNIRRDPEEMNNLINKEPDLYRKLAKKLAKWEKNECIEPSWLEEGWRKITNRYHQQLMHNEIKTAQDLYKKK